MHFMIPAVIDVANGDVYEKSPTNYEPGRWETADAESAC